MLEKFHVLKINYINRFHYPYKYQVQLVQDNVFKTRILAIAQHLNVKHFVNGV